MSTPEDPTAPAPAPAVPGRLDEFVTLDPVPLAQAPTLHGASSAPEPTEFSAPSAPWMLGAFRILGKLGARDRAGLVVIAYESGLVGIDVR